MKVIVSYKDGEVEARIVGNVFKERGRKEWKKFRLKRILKLSTCAHRSPPFATSITQRSFKGNSAVRLNQELKEKEKVLRKKIASLRGELC